MASEAGEDSVSTAPTGTNRPFSKPTVLTAPWASTCSIGNASKNSLATTSSGPSSGSVERSSCHVAPGILCACAARSTGLVSTKWTGGVSPAPFIARSASAASVPRPGPSST